MTLRPMRWFDIAPVAELDARCFGADAWTPDFYWGQAAVPGNSFLVDTADDGRIAGFAGLFISGPQADVLTIGTQPELRGRGIGGGLLDALITAAREAECSALHLEVRADNDTAIGMYEARGFEAVGTRPGYYHGADALLMRALLD